MENSKKSPIQECQNKSLTDADHVLFESLMLSRSRRNEKQKQYQANYMQRKCAADLTFRATQLARSAIYRREKYRNDLVYREKCKDRARSRHHYSKFEHEHPENCEPSHQE